MDPARELRSGAVVLRGFEDGLRPTVRWPKGLSQRMVAEFALIHSAS